MAFDFPSSPSLNQQYTPIAGVVYTWNGYGWLGAVSGYAPINSPVFTGDPLAPTPSTADNDTSIATTAFVKALNYLSASATATITTGYTFTPNNLGTISSGSITPNPALGNYQYYSNNGSHTILPPTSDCAIDIMVVNLASAGTISFGGFIVGTTGDPLTTLVNNRFIISIRRINTLATYTIKALQ